MDGSGSGGGKLFGRFSEPAHRALDQAREEAERCGHRYLGPEHVLLGVLAEGQSRAARVLRAYGMDLMAARAALARLADRGVVPAPRPTMPSCWVRWALTWTPSGATPSRGSASRRWGRRPGG
jgi:Clp amino terminal domain, pathogenicity island component